MSAELEPDRYSPTPVQGLRVRAMTPNDLLYIAGIEQTSYAYPWSDGIFRDCLKAGYYCRVAEVKREIIGYALMSMGAGEAHVLNVCVRIDFREQGIGRFFMHHLIAHAHESACRDLFLEVRPSNPAAIHLYETLGFLRVGIRKGYYQASLGREDAWVYRKELPT